MSEVINCNPSPTGAGASTVQCGAPPAAMECWGGGAKPWIVGSTQEGHSRAETNIVPFLQIPTQMQYCSHDP